MSTLMPALCSRAPTTDEVSCLQIDQQSSVMIAAYETISFAEEDDEATLVRSLMIERGVRAM